MTTLEKIESLMIPEEKAKEITTGFGDVLIQVAIKYEGDDVNECVSVHGCFPAILSGIHTALDAMSERCGIPASELAKTIAMAAEMGESNEQKSEVK